MDWRSIEIEELGVLSFCTEYWPRPETDRDFDEWSEHHLSELARMLGMYERRHPGRGISVAMDRLKTTTRALEHIATALASLVEAVVAQEGDSLTADKTEVQRLKNHQAVREGGQFNLPTTGDERVRPTVPGHRR